MSGTTANAGIGGTSRRSLALLALGIAALMLPVHYSFYRYSLVGEGGFYALVHGFLACFFAAVYVLLFFAWVQRLTDAMFQLPILAVLGVVGASVVGLYLLVDLFYGTPVYGLAVIVCLAVSGVCWQACPLAAVRADERLRALPDAATVRVWVPLLAAYVLVTLLHALVFSAEGSVFERASAHARLIDTGRVVVGVLFCGLAAAGRLRGAAPAGAYPGHRPDHDVLRGGLLPGGHAGRHGGRRFVRRAEHDDAHAAGVRVLCAREHVLPRRGGPGLDLGTAVLGRGAAGGPCVLRGPGPVWLAGL